MATEEKSHLEILKDDLQAKILARNAIFHTWEECHADPNHLSKRYYGLMAEKESAIKRFDHELAMERVTCRNACNPSHLAKIDRQISDLNAEIMQLEKYGHLFRRLVRELTLTDPDALEDVLADMGIDLQSVIDGTFSGVTAY